MMRFISNLDLTNKLNQEEQIDQQKWTQLPQATKSGIANGQENKINNLLTDSFLNFYVRIIIVFALFCAKIISI
jgi:hypothetical protein